MLATEDRSDAKTLGAIGLCWGALVWLLINLTRLGGVSFDLFLLAQNALERRHQHPMAVAYDPDDRVIGVFSNATEFDALPADGRAPEGTQQ